MMMNGGVAPMPPRLTNRGIEVNPSPHEIAIGSLEQWRRSKMTMIWKSVLVSLVKGEGLLCVWRDAIGPGSRMELLQRVPFRDIQHVHSDHGGILRVSLYYSSEEPLTFRCMQEPQAIHQWVSALRSVMKNGHRGYGHGHQVPTSSHRPAPAAAAPKPVVSAPAAPAVDFLSQDVAATGATPDFLMGSNPQPTVRPVQYQSYPPANGTAFPAQTSPQARSPHGQASPNNMFAPNNNFGQPQQGGYPMQQPTQQQQAYPQQQPTYQPQFSQPPPLPKHRSINQSANYKTKPSAFNPQPPMPPIPPMQPTSFLNPQQQQQRARSVSPMPMGGYNRGKSPVRPQQMPKAKSPTNVTKDHYKAQPLQPAYKSIPKPAPAPAPAPAPVPRAAAPRAVPRPNAKKTPRRSLSAPMSPQRPKTVNKGPGPVSPEELKKHIMVSWALIPPRCIKLKSMIDLCRSIQLTFPPHNKMIQPHVYFDTWMPVTPGEYNQTNGINKIIKKCRFFLHPDKLPRDFTPDQILLCKLLWDILADAQQRQMRD